MKKINNCTFCDGKGQRPMLGRGTTGVWERCPVCKGQPDCDECCCKCNCKCNKKRRS